VSREGEIGKRTQQLGSPPPSLPRPRSLTHSLTPSLAGTPPAKRTGTPGTPAIGGPSKTFKRRRLGLGRDFLPSSRLFSLQAGNMAKMKGVNPSTSSSGKKLANSYSHHHQYFIPLGTSAYASGLVGGFGLPDRPTDQRHQQQVLHAGSARQSPPGNTSPQANDLMSQPVSSK
jgi:hypothetical protein